MRSGGWRGGRPVLPLICALALSGCADIGASVSGLVDEVSETLTPLLESDAEQAARAEAMYREAVALDAQERPEAAAEMFRQAAELDHAAAYALGEAHNRGRGVAPDPALAAEWFNRAAARGEPRAQFLIGAAYYAGTGVTQDHGIAVEYPTKAAEQGHPRAQFLLAEAFVNGRGVGKDLAWAARIVPSAAGGPGDPPTIIYVQQQLNALGYDAGSVDGVFGPRTQVALSAYQSAKGIDSSGRITPRLLQSLRAGAPGSG